MAWVVIAGGWGGGFVLTWGVAFFLVGVGTVEEGYFVIGCPSVFFDLAGLGSSSLGGWWVMGWGYGHIVVDKINKGCDMYA
jgi:hypothetical protein